MHACTGEPIGMSGVDQAAARCLKRTLTLSWGGLLSSWSICEPSTAVLPLHAAGGYFREEKLVKNVISSFLDALGYLHLKVSPQPCPALPCPALQPYAAYLPALL